MDRDRESWKRNTSEDGEGGDDFFFSSPMTLVGIFRGSYGRAKENKTDSPGEI